MITDMENDTRWIELVRRIAAAAAQAEIELGWLPDDDVTASNGPEGTVVAALYAYQELGRDVPEPLMVDIMEYLNLHQKDDELWWSAENTGLVKDTRPVVV